MYDDFQADFTKRIPFGHMISRMSLQNDDTAGGSSVPYWKYSIKSYQVS